MKKTGLIALFVVMIMVLVCFVGCAQQAPAATDATDGQGEAATSEDAGFFGIRDKSQEYYMITYASGAVYYTYMYDTWAAVGEKLGVSALNTGVTGADLTELAQIVDQVVSKGACGILLTCPDAKGCVEMINKAVDAGVPVCTVEADSPESKRYCYLSCDAYTVGQKVADTLAAAINETGKCIVVTDIGPDQHNTRVRGFRDRIAEKYPNMSCDDAAVLNAEVSTELAAELTTAYIQANPDLAGIYSGYGEMSIGILTALNDLGLTGKIPIVALGEDETTCLAIKNGELYASLTQGRYNETYWGLIMLYALHNGYVGEMENWEEAGAAVLPTYINPGYAMMTKDNIDIFIDTYFGGPID